MSAETTKFIVEARKLLPKAYQNNETRIMAAKPTRLVAVNTYLRPLILEKWDMKWVFLTYKRVRPYSERTL